MKILVISHKYPPSIGGMQKQCFELVKGLNSNHEVVELIFRGNGSNVVFLLTAWWKALRLIAKHPDTDLVYANDGLMAFFLTPLFWWSSVKKVVTIHGLDIVFPFTFYQRWARKYLNTCAAIIAVSAATADELVSRGIKKELVHTVRNGFDPDLSSTTAPAKPLAISVEGKTVLVSIGRSVRRKGFSWFIQHVFPQLPGDTIYIIIGPKLSSYTGLRRLERWLPAPIYKLIVLLNGIPVDEMEVHRLIDEMSLNERVFHIAGLDHDQKHHLLERSSLFIMPNLKVDGDFEGFGLVALEAVMTGTLCLAACVDGIPSAIEDGKNGFLLPSGDPDIWLQEINNWLANKAAIKKKAEEFRAYTLHHCLTWDQMAQQYVEIFMKITREGRTEEK